MSRSTFVILCGLCAACQDPTIAGADGTSGYAIPDATTGPIVISCEEEEALGELLACTQTNLNRPLQVYGSTLYWYTPNAQNDDGIYTLPIAGGEPTRLHASSRPIRGLRLHDEQAYWVYAWATGGRISLTDQSTLDYNFVYEPDDHFAVDDEYVYLAQRTPSRIERVPVSGGSPATLYADIEFNSFSHLFAIDEVLLWTSGGLDTGEAEPTLWLAPRDGSAAPLALVSGADAALSTFMTATDEHIYWGADRLGGSGALVRIPRTAEGPAELIAELDRAPQQIAVDASHVYWVDNPSLVRVAVDGGSIEELAEADIVSRNVAADEGYVYWYANYGFRRFPK